MCNFYFLLNVFDILNLNAIGTTKLLLATSIAVYCFLNVFGKKCNFFSQEVHKIDKTKPNSNKEKVENKIRAL